MRRRTAANDLCLGTTLTRVDPDGDPVPCDVVVYFDVASYTPGARATWTDPGWGPEYEFSFRSAEFDGEPDDAPGPLTAIEIATLQAWFDANHSGATECANDNHHPEDAA